jgi:RHS repeat-associated protein
MDDMPVAVIDGTTLRYIESDHLNIPRALIDPARNVAVWRWDLNGSAFGEHAANQDPDADGTAVTFNLRFPGQYLDAETGLHYNYFRDYEPGVGRYVESDPIGLRGGIATYGYSNSKPLTVVDAFGLFGYHMLTSMPRCGGYPGGYGCSGLPPPYVPPSCRSQCNVVCSVVLIPVCIAVGVGFDSMIAGFSCNASKTINCALVCELNCSEPECN